MLRIDLPNQKKTRIKLPRVTGITILLLGLIAFTLAIVYSSSVPAFIGLGLTFWGIIILYIQNEAYTKDTILDATTTSLLTTLNQTLQELEYRGKAIYLPPKYLNNPEDAKAYIPKQKTGKLPTPEQTQSLETQPSSRNAQGMLITPPGAELTRLAEQTLGTLFTKTNLEYLQQNLPKLFIEDFEIATNLEIQPSQDKTPNTLDSSTDQIEQKHDTVHFKITAPAYRNTRKQAQQLPRIHANIGCPLTSAIACMIAKATGKPTILETQQTSEDGQTTETEYRLLEEEPAWP